MKTARVAIRHRTDPTRPTIVRADQVEDDDVLWTDVLAQKAEAVPNLLDVPVARGALAEALASITDADLIVAVARVDDRESARAVYAARLEELEGPAPDGVG